MSQLEFIICAALSLYAVGVALSVVISNKIEKADREVMEEKL